MPIYLTYTGDFSYLEKELDKQLDQKLLNSFKEWVGNNSKDINFKKYNAIKIGDISKSESKEDKKIYTFN